MERERACVVCCSAFAERVFVLIDEAGVAKSCKKGYWRVKRIRLVGGYMRKEWNFGCDKSENVEAF